MFAASAQSLSRAPATVLLGRSGNSSKIECAMLLQAYDFNSRYVNITEGGKYYLPWESVWHSLCELKAGGEITYLLFPAHFFPSEPGLRHGG